MRISSYIACTYVEFSLIVRTTILSPRLTVYSPATRIRVKFKTKKFVSIFSDFLCTSFQMIFSTWSAKWLFLEYLEIELKNNYTRFDIY